MSASEEGFTILETLVAFAILSTVLVALYGATGASLRLIVESKRAKEAATLMQSKLDELAANRYPLPTIASGTFPNTDVSWRVEARELAGRRAGGEGIRLQDVHLTVRWPRGSDFQSFAVETRHLGTSRP